MPSSDVDGARRDARHLAAVPPAGAAEAAPVGLRIESADSTTPLFAGFTAAGPVGDAVLVRSFTEFAEIFGDDGDGGPFMPGAALPYAVRGFFGNGGQRCWVHRIDGWPGAGRIRGSALERLLDPPAPIVAVPDAYGLVGGIAAATELQRRLVAAAEEAYNRVVVLDPPPGLSPADAVLWRRRTCSGSAAAVVYYPWVEVLGAPRDGALAVPSSGHVLGAWARVDGEHGLHRAPTGEPLLGIDRLPISVSSAEQRTLNREGVNCVRAFPGPEPRVWGARTLSTDTDWRYLHRRRTFTNLVASVVAGTRWIEREPLDDALLERLRAAIAAFLQAAWRRGALQGASAGQAFSIECESADHSNGHVSLELGLALRQPGDYRVTRILMRTASAA